MLDRTTVIIKTIGRKSLKQSISSANREGFKTIVVSDGAKVSSAGANKFIRLGRQWGFYGGMAANVGAAVAETEFITFLDDDDEFVPGAGNIIRAKLEEKPDVDVWIAGVRFNKNVEMHNTATGEVTYRGTDLALWPDGGLNEGNVAMPTYRTSIFSKVPFMDVMPKEAEFLADLNHVRICAKAGYKVDWFESALYLVRPRGEEEGLAAYNGRGK